MQGEGLPERLSKLKMSLCFLLGEWIFVIYWPEFLSSWHVIFK